MARAKKYKSVIIDSINKQISKAEKEKVESKMLLSLKIKLEMTKKGINNSGLAKALKKQESQVTKWLSGTHNFTHDTLIEIQGVLGIKLINTNEKENLMNPQFNVQIKLERGQKSFTPNVVANQISINNLNTNIADC